VYFLAFKVGGMLFYSFWVALGVTVVAMFIIGIVAEDVDNAPGGFNNPSDKDAK